VSAGLSVIASGMVTSVGNSGPATTAALRSGIRGVSAGKIWDWSGGDYLNVGRPQLHQWWEGRDMLAEVAAPAIEECTLAAETLLRVPQEAVPIVLIVAPPDRPQRWPDLDQAAGPDLSRRLGRKLARGSAFVPAGRTGILRALDHAAALFASREHQVCVIAGVESFLRQSVADHYMQERRLLTAANSNGFTLGEAGAAILVIPETTRYRGTELAILGTGRAHDPSGAGGTAKHGAKGDGLTDAIRQALAAARLEHRDLDLRFSDANGEHWKFKDAVFATNRLDRLRPPGNPRMLGKLDHWHPIEFIGEVGSAIGPLLLGWALHAGQKRYLHGPRMLVHTSEDSGERAALVVEYRSGERRGMR
jgi:3-oxoacyl-[acyl-carrier-protein] synthase-1